MFDPSIGRWFGEDPRGFGAGDPNLYRFVGNNPTNATDPSGLAEEGVPAGVQNKPDANKLYGDDFIYYGGPFKAASGRRAAPSYVEAIKQLVELRELSKTNKLLTLNVYYVNGIGGAGAWAEHAVKNGHENSINYYYGHGTGLVTGEVDPTTVAKVRAAFKDVAESDKRKFLFNGCYPSQYNGAIKGNVRVKQHYANLVAGSETGTISEADAFARFYVDAGFIYKSVKSSLAKKQAIEVNLYFGQEGDRTALETKYPRLKNIGEKYRFANWTEFKPASD